MYATWEVVYQPLIFQAHELVSSLQYSFAYKVFGPKGEDAKKLHDGINNDQNPEDMEEEDDDDGYVKDGYNKDGYYYDHDPNLFRVTKELEATQTKLAEQEKLTEKMKRMMARVQDKFKDLAESDNDPSVEVMAKDRALGKTKAETSNPRKD
uniref:Uncharacterized protein n=1 Tax=Cannabis sativa TaxID=3483 RepID=A0A803QGL0_CANSA